MGTVKETLRRTSLYRLYSDVRWRERTIHAGNDHPDRCFFVIRRHSADSGLFSFYATNLGSVREAFDRGLTPVIDMQNSPNPMISQEEVGRVNAWDLFFTQPAGYSLSDIAQAKNVTLSGIHPPEKWPDEKILEEGNEEVLAEWRALAHRHMQLLPSHENEAKQYFETAFAGKTPLGVLVRGTDYTAGKPSGHPVQPELSDVIARCGAFLSDGSADCVYLATEDESVYRVFADAFPGKVFSYQTTRFAPGDGTLLNRRADVQNAGTPYERSREYLISVRVLSLCPHLVAGCTSGTVGAVLMSDGFRSQYIYHLGTYE